MNDWDLGSILIWERNALNCKLSKSARFEVKPRYLFHIPMFNSVLLFSLNKGFRFTLILVSQPSTNINTLPGFRHNCSPQITQACPAGISGFFKEREQALSKTSSCYTSLSTCKGINHVPNVLQAFVHVSAGSIFPLSVKVFRPNLCYKAHILSQAPVKTWHFSTQTRNPYVLIHHASIKKKINKTNKKHF